MIPSTAGLWHRTDKDRDFQIKVLNTKLEKLGKVIRMYHDRKTRPHTDRNIIELIMMESQAEIELKQLIDQRNFIF